ncbi:glycosyltransferase family 39 protein [Moorellaceae bacterium AZ2]
MLVFIAATLALLTGSYSLANRLALRSRADRWLACGLLFLFGQVLIILLAGAVLKQLQRWTVLLLALAWLGIGTLRNGRRSLSLQTVLLLLGQRNLGLRPTGIPPILAGNHLLLVVGGLLFFSLSALALGWIYLPPFAWDEIWYHLTPVAAWAKQGAITQLPEALLWQNYDPHQVPPDQLALDFSTAFNWANVYPLNAELSALWSMVLLNSDILADAAQLPFVLVGAIATLGLSRLAGARTESSLLAAMLFLLTPMILIQLRVAYADAAFGSLVAASIYVLLRWQKEGNLSYALLLGIALGLMMGIKSPGIAFAGILGLAALGHGLWQCRCRRLTSRALLFQAAVALGGLLSGGGFWYLRTWWFYGNPVYPIQVKFLVWTLPGMGDVSQLFMAHNTPPAYRHRPVFLNILSSWLELGDESYNYYSRTRGLGPTWAALALPALGPFAFYALRRHRATVLWMTGLTALLLTVQPAPWWPRYVLYVVPVGLAALVWVYERLPKAWQTLVAALLILNLAVSTTLTLGETLEKLPLALRLDAPHRTFGQLYFQDYAWVDELPPSRIGHTPMAWVYPLYGGLRHEVYLVDAVSASSWAEAIRRQSLDFVVVNPNYGPYAGWAGDLPNLLAPYWKGGQIHVYRVRR